MNLAFLALCLPAQANQTVEGDVLRISYSDNGNWNDDTVRSGLEAWLDDDWVDFSYPGNDYQMWAVVFERDSVETTGYATSFYYSTDMTVVSEADTSGPSTAESTYEVQVGDLSIVKTETWPLDGSVVLVAFQLTNDGADPVDDLRLIYAVDPDQDAGGWYDYSTLDDTVDLDGDGDADWVQSIGPNSGYALAFGACDDDLVEVGHYSSWSYVVSADKSVSDYNGSDADDAMAIRVSLPDSIEPGETAWFSFLVVVADTVEAAQNAFAADFGRCWECDRDFDGYPSPGACGGSDCDDGDATANPDALETWYDGVDGDCDGASDYDADGDGYDSLDWEGADCDDGDAAVHPGAPETWYDGVDGDCDGASDDDADGDGYDAPDDCDDADDTVNPGAVETWYDDVDSDCDGADDGDADGDGYSLDAGDCDDSDPDVHPDAPDASGDGLDSDCDGSDDASPDNPSADDTGNGSSTVNGSSQGGMSSCGCSTGAPGAGSWLLVTALAALIRRGRRRTQAA